MNLCFISYTMDFNVSTPYESPLGGTESAMAYLAVELASRGHRVVLLSHTHAPGEYFGVTCLTLEQETPEFFAAQQFDAVIVSNAPVRGPFLRSILPSHTRLALWCSHDKDQPAMRPLLDPKVVAVWDRFIVLSEYQRTGFVNRFRMDPANCSILRYGISPSFENLFPDRESFFAAKNEPVLVYTSTPFRGLDLLHPIFTQFHNHFPETRLRVYSSLQVYQAAELPEMQALYEKLSNQAGVEYIGSLPQKHLSIELKPALILAYPCTFAETSCIAVMEAMAAGAFVITSELGALPETCASFAELVPVTLKSKAEFANLYLRSLVTIYMEIVQHREQILDHLWTQVQYTNRRYTWKIRAVEWETVLNEMIAAA